MSENKKPITKAGYEKLCKEIENLIDVERPEIGRIVADARALGDLSENAEYQAGREKQRNIEAKIRHLQIIMSHSQVIDHTNILDKSAVRFGSTVTIYDITNDKEMKFTIVSAYESDVKNNLLSSEAPIARALIGKKIGDICKIDIGDNNSEIEIQEIEYL